jgi:Lon-like protease
MNRKTILGVLLAALLLTGYMTRPDYFVLTPGTAEDLKGFVQVPESPGGDEGTFYLVTVSQQRATWPLFIYGLVNPAVDLIPLQQAIPPGMDPEDYRDLMRQYMVESQLLAKTLALRRAGYTVPVESDGVLVVEVVENSPARGILRAGDVIKSVEGRRVMLTEELIHIVQAREVGQAVELSFERDGVLQQAAVQTAEHPDLKGRAALRVLVRTLNWQPVLPVAIDIETGGITGPSAGLMFVLEILNQLDADDITGGRRIAGTGTVNIQEVVGPIGGVKQKVVAAEKAGAEFFLVPEENRADAEAMARTIRVVPVRTLQEALDFLETLTAANPSSRGFFMGLPELELEGSGFSGVWVLQGGAEVVLAGFAVGRLRVEEMVEVASPEIEGQHFFAPGIRAVAEVAGGPGDEGELPFFFDGT